MTALRGGRPAVASSRFRNSGDRRLELRAASERARLAGLLEPWLAGGVEHVGSTAVPGSAAKPVRASWRRVRDPGAVVAQAGSQLEADGWCCVPPQLDGRPRRRFYVKPDTCGSDGSRTCT
jgi:GrpB protein